LGKLTVSISDELEKRLRSYITRKFADGKLYGKLSEVVEQALKEWLERNESLTGGS